jgi:hypothetical protein
MACSPPMNTARQVAWLQGITLAWMLFECGVSFYGAISAKDGTADKQPIAPRCWHSALIAL